MSQDHDCTSESNIFKLNQSLRAFGVSESGIERSNHAHHYAHKWHNGQMRKCGCPYVTHTVAVAIILMSWLIEVKAALTRLMAPISSIHDDAIVRLIIAALVHDLVEDVDALDLTDIEREFGDKQVASLVDSVTKIETTAANKARIETISKLLIHAISSCGVAGIFIKLADRLHNMKTLGVMNSDKQASIAKETWDFYAPLADLLGIRVAYRELMDSSFEYVHPKEFNETKEILASTYYQRKALIESVRYLLQQEFDKSDVKVEVILRRRHLYGLFKKRELHSEREWPLNSMADPLVIVILTDNEDDCYGANSVLRTISTPWTADVKNYLDCPKRNGFSSLRKLVRFDSIDAISEHIFEVQVTTRNMHLTAEYGFLARWFYEEEQKFQADCIAQIIDFAGELDNQ